METTATTVRRGLTYEVIVRGQVEIAQLALETVFTCHMYLPGTDYSIKKRTMYLPGRYRVKTTTTVHLVNCSYKWSLHLYLVFLFQNIRILY